VTPETKEHLDKAREYLTKARGLLDVLHYNDEAGRAAYLAALHAANALISERTGKIATSHGGVNSQFNLLTRGEPRLDPELRRFLPQAYNLKAVADYETGPGAVVPLERGRGGNSDRHQVRGMCGEPHSRERSQHAARIGQVEALTSFT
jgi:uncharacterized protein (UPF0332 family)